MTTRAPTAMRREFVSKKFLKFLITGGFAAAVNWGSRIVYNIWMPYSAAIFAAFLTGLVTAFVLAKLFVFTESQHSTARSAVLFVLVNLVAIMQTWGVSVGLAYFLFPWIGINWHTRDMAHLVGVCVPVFTSYIGHKHFTFRR